VMDDIDEDAALAGIAATVDYFRLIKIPITLTESVGERCRDEVAEIANLCTYHKTRSIGSFKVLDYDAVKRIYQSMV